MLRTSRSKKRIWWAFVVSLALVAFAGPALPVLGQSVDETAPEREARPQVVIEVPEEGVGYSGDGELLVVAMLTNVSDTTSKPIDVTTVLLNECIVPNVLQTCRFVAFGVFEDVTPDGIEPGATVQWTFNFGPYPELDLNRWSVIWYQTPADPAG